MQMKITFAYCLWQKPSTRTQRTMQQPQVMTSSGLFRFSCFCIFRFSLSVNKFKLLTMLLFPPPLAILILGVQNQTRKLELALVSPGNKTCDQPNPGLMAKHINPIRLGAVPMLTQDEIYWCGGYRKNLCWKWDKESGTMILATRTQAFRWFASGTTLNSSHFLIAGTKN
jgi:hypothetical protein